MKICKVVLVVTIFTFIVFFSSLLKVEAHTTNMGISGYDGITYDPCEPFSTDYPEPGNSDNETWYTMLNIYDGEKVMFHIDDDIQTIYYKVHDINPSEPLANWGDTPDDFKTFISFGIYQWNAISIYKTNAGGHLYPTKLVNFVDIDTIAYNENITPHVNIYPAPGDEFTPYSGYTQVVESSIVEEDTQTYLNVTHSHFTQFDIYLVEPVIQRNFDVLYSTVAHELGHVLGLGDIDVVESEYIGEYHHQEVLMGYPNDDTERQPNVTYRDLVGVMIARGLHTNEEHVWLYDEESSSIGNYKLICTICNCVKYVNNLNNYEYDIYKKCLHEHSYEEAHILASGNMIPVAKFDYFDYWKCKYCRYICWVQDRAENFYEYTGICDENTHILENHVKGLEYTIQENHNFKVNIGNNVLKCSSCPMCNNGNIYDGDITSYTLECIMDHINVIDSLDVKESMMYKLDIDCKSIYNIEVQSDQKLVIEVFDSQMQKTTLPFVSLGDGSHLKLEMLFNPDVYYIRIRPENYDVECNYNLIINSSIDFYKTPIDLNEEISLFDHHHYGYSEYEYHNTEVGFYKITLNAISENIAIFHDETIIVKNSLGKVVEKLPLYILSPYAISNSGQNSLYIYFDTVDDYTFAVDYNLSSVDNITICIEKLDNMNFPEYNIFTSGMLNICNDASTLIDYIYKLIPKQSSQYQFDVSYDGDAGSTKTTLFIIIRKHINLNNTVSYSIVNYKALTANQQYSVRLDLVDSDEYYVGYLGSGIEGNIDINMFTYMEVHNGSIVTDPDRDTNCGTEVTMNNGTYRGTIITQGFSRLCYFTNETISTSRLDYYWYVSDESVAEVTDFGTILAKNVTTTKYVDVIAVYKYDMSYVVCTAFTIVPDTLGYNVSYIYNINLSSNSTYQIQSYNDWPSLIRQHYDWISTDPSIATVTSWGQVVTNGTGTVDIYGEYIYNRRYRVNITLIIT